mmetsp:Transcript_79442/g.140204  ORF Transcript_79442/g.140204 Transcript_79442/m.140204 type:complete len:233 (+) Transcript_79442:865-1563(+)
MTLVVLFWTSRDWASMAVTKSCNRRIQSPLLPSTMVDSCWPILKDVFHKECNPCRRVPSSCRCRMRPCSNSPAWRLWVAYSWSHVFWNFKYMRRSSHTTLPLVSRPSNWWTTASRTSLLCKLTTLRCWCSRSNCSRPTLGMSFGGEGSWRGVLIGVGVGEGACPKLVSKVSGSLGGLGMSTAHSPVSPSSSSPSASSPKTSLLESMFPMFGKPRLSKATGPIDGLVLSKTSR